MKNKLFDIGGKTNKDYKVIVVHPGKQHSYRLCEALEKQGYLCKFITSSYNKKGTITRLLYRLSSGQQKKKIGGHYSKEIPDEKVKVVCEGIGLIALLLIKFPKIRAQYVKWNQFLNDSFAKKTAKIILKNKPDCVISYDNNSKLLFEMLKERDPSITCILDTSIVARPYMYTIFNDNIELTGDDVLKREEPGAFDAEIVMKCKREIELADYYFAASDIVEKSLIYSGAKQKNIFRIPYGVDINTFTSKTHKSNTNLKMIFVGQVNRRKGIHHLLNVVSKYNIEDVELYLVGAYSKNSDLYMRYEGYSNIHFLGFATHDRLATLYQDADVFVLPSLAEGMAMVILEAMSCALPVIISSNTGGASVISEGKDGLVFAAGNEEALDEKIQWCIKNKDQLEKMGKNALNKAQNYTWDTYYQNVIKAICSIMEIGE